MAAYLRVLRETLPQGFVLENVEGLAYKGKDEGLRAAAERRRGDQPRARERATSLRSSGSMRPTTGCRSCAHRVLVIGGARGAELPGSRSRRTPTWPRAGFCCRSCRRTARHGTRLADVRPDASEDLAVRGQWAELLPSIPEGHNYLWHTDRARRAAALRVAAALLVVPAEAREESPVVDDPGAAGAGDRAVPLGEPAAVDARELCRLQTFPDDVVVTGSRGAQQKQIGNAVPSLLGEVVGREIRVQLPRGSSRCASGLTLMPPDRSPAPPPERVRVVPARFRLLAGQHEAHPGTGRGTRASARALSA